MSKVIFDNSGNRLYELGVDKCVMYSLDNRFAAWNGVTEIAETKNDVTETIGFIDGVKYVNQISSSNFSASITAYTYPDLLSEHVGDIDEGYTNQKLKPFNMTYRTLIGNDTENEDYGYKLHLVYNITAVPTQTDFSSSGKDITLTDFSWELNTTPLTIPYMKPSSHFVINSKNVYPEVLSALERILYGDDKEDPSFPSFDELVLIFEENSEFRIINHGDGTYTAIGDDDSVKQIDAKTIELTSPSVFLISEDTFQASTY